jgi:two-component sensor histidine kinase/integral membrane sensor domain MASE1
MLQNLSKEVHHRSRADLMLPWISAIGLTIAVGIAYFLAAQLSLAFLAEPDGVAVFWPAAGVSSGVLIALGRDGRLPVAGGAMIATVIANLMGDRNVWSATAFAFCNAGEALLTAWLIERYFGPNFRLDRLRNVLGLLAAAVVATAASAIGGTVAFKLFHSPTAPLWTTWHHWFASDAVGIITVAPLVIGLAEAVREPPPRNEIIEGVVALAALAAMTVIIVSLPPEPWKTVRPVALLFPILLWIAVRCQPVFAAAAAFIVSLTIVWKITFGIGDFRILALAIGDRIMGAQAAILGVALCAYVLAALFAERRRAEARQTLLIAELDHRVKNVLARVAALAVHTRRGSGTMDEFVQALNGRIQSMAVAHGLLSQSRWCRVGLTDLVRRQLAPYTTEINTTICGPDVMLTAAETQAVAMVIHELVTNAAKYGALSSPDGRVSVSWDRPRADMAMTLTITWRELGGPPIAAPVQSGYGSSLIRDLIPHELGGTVDLVFPSDGACCKIEIPLRAKARLDRRASSFTASPSARDTIKASGRAGP